MVSKRSSAILAATLLIVAAAAYTGATWRYFTTQVPGGNDFMAHYSAWEAYLKHGLNPYSDEAARYTQIAIRGRPALAGEDQNRLTYPFYSLLVHAPFIALDYALARALYMTLLQAALVAGVALTLALVNWRPPLWLLAWLLLWCVLNYSEARGIILGQFAIFGFAALAGCLFLLRRRHDAAAGALLVVTTVKPTLVFLVVPFLLLWAVARRRWTFAGSFVGTLAALCLGSLVLLPTWIGDWLRRIQDYPSYTAGESPVWLLTHAALPGLGPLAQWGTVLLLVGSMFWVWWRALQPAPDLGARFHLALGLSLLVSALIVPRSATTNYVMLLLPTLWVFAALDRQSGWGRPVLIAVMLAGLIVPWWLHFATVVGNQEQAIAFFPWPLALLVGLWLMKRPLLEEAAHRPLSSPAAYSLSPTHDNPHA